MQYFDRKGNVIPLETWAPLFQNGEYKRVEFSTINETTTVSTVWVGINHAFSEDDPILIFETMVFGGEYNEYVVRYSTEEEAKRGHRKITSWLEGHQTTIFNDEMEIPPF